MNMAAARDLPRLIINIDDLGMCHGANAAFLDLYHRGRCDSGSVMVPCPWFPEIAEAGAQDPSLKLGVHFTITAEKKYYRWRPLTAPSRASGLVDEDGYFHDGVAAVRRHAEPEAVEAELRAQIEAFLGKGLAPTHFDPHQGAVLAPEFVQIYIRLGTEYDVPVVFPRDLSAYGPLHNLPELDAASYRETASRLEAEGHLLADRVLETPWHRDAPAERRYRSLFAEVGPGLTFMAMHANVPGEIEAIEPDTAAIRVEEYDLLRGPGESIGSTVWRCGGAHFQISERHRFECKNRAAPDPAAEGNRNCDRRHKDGGQTDASIERQMPADRDRFRRDCVAE